MSDVGALVLEWGPGPEAPAPGPGEVHVWRVGLNREVPFSRLLSKVEQQRAERYRFEQDRRRFRVRRGMLRLLLGRYTGISPQDCELEVNEWDKPGLSRRQAEQSLDVRFSLSSCEDQAVYAFAVGHDVGIDVEAVQRAAELSELRSSICTAEECHRLDSMLEPERADYLLRRWVAIEAVGKAAGHGLAKEIDHDTEGLVQRLGDACLRWFAPGAGCWACLAVAKPGPRALTVVGYTG